MGEQAGTTTRLVDRLRNRDGRAADHLVAYARQRLYVLAHRMLCANRAVRSLIETDDLLQEAMMRLNRALSEVIPESSRHFWNLAAVMLSRALSDLNRKYRGRHGWWTNHAPAGTDIPEPPARQESNAPKNWDLILAQSENIQGPREREVFRLHFYMGLTFPQIAEQLGISESTVKRCWLRALHSLNRLLGDEGSQQSSE